MIKKTKIQVYKTVETRNATCDWCKEPNNAFCPKCGEGNEAVCEEGETK